MQPKVQYKQPPLLFRNLGKGKFENVPPPWARLQPPDRGARRGLRATSTATAISTSWSPPTTAPRTCTATTAATGTTGCRCGCAARSRTATASAPWCGWTARRGKQWNMVRSGSSYCSQSDLALTFGLGKDDDGAGARNRVAERGAAAIDRCGGVPVFDDSRRSGDPLKRLRHVAQAL